MQESPQVKNERIFKVDKMWYNLTKVFGGIHMQEIWNGITNLLIYFVVCASTALITRVRITIDDELFRKILHGILLGSLYVWVISFETWWIVALTAIGFAVIVYPCLMLAEHIKGYSKVVTERKSGELKQSLLIVFFMFAAVVTVCWGWLDDKMLALASIYAWGFGDAVAALVGKRFGKHKIGGKIEHIRKKSVEGTAAMCAVSFVSVFVILVLRGGISYPLLIVTAAAVAVVSAATELVTPNGLDTITCPLAAMAVLLPLVHLFGGI